MNTCEETFKHANLMLVVFTSQFPEGLAVVADNLGNGLGRIGFGIAEKTFPVCPKDKGVLNV